MAGLSDQGIAQKRDQLCASAPGSCQPQAPSIIRSAIRGPQVSGAYSFTLPAGTYPSATASLAGFASRTATGIVVNEGATTTRNLSRFGA